MPGQYELTPDELRRALVEANARLLERDTEIVELNHRIANILQITASALKLERDRAADATVKQALNDAMTRVFAAAQFNRHLAQYRSRQEVDLGRFLQELLPQMDAVTGLRSAVDAESVMVATDTALKLATVITELVLNARKHGYDGKDGGALAVRCHREDGRLYVSVADQGKGLTDGFDPQQPLGLGMAIVCSIARQLNGELEIDGDRGARFTLIVPAT